VQEPLPLPTGSTGFNYVRQTGIHAAEPLVPEPTAYEIETATENVKRHFDLLITFQWDKAACNASWKCNAVYYEIGPLTTVCSSAVILQ